MVTRSDLDSINRSASLKRFLLKSTSRRVLFFAFIPQGACAAGSGHTKSLETVATRVVPATASFYSARGIGSQASVGVAVDEKS